MTIIAFDVSKHELVGVRADKNGTVKENFIVPNTEEEIKAFLTSGLEKHGKLIMGSESTGEYHRELAQQAVNCNIPFYLLNPILTKQFTRSTIRKKKTDKTDAAIIARLLAQGEGSLVSKTSLNPIKQINRTANSIGTLRKSILAMRIHLEQICPEETGVLAQIEASRTALEQTVESLQTHVQKNTDKPLKKLLMSIPGVGERIAATLIAELGTIHRFKDGKRLVAYAGLDPKVNQSGTSLNKNTKLTKRGSPCLRQAAYMAAFIAVQHDPELKEYFEKKRKEGKCYREGVIATSRKILYRVHAVWKRGTPYVKRAIENNETTEKNIDKKLSP